MKYGMNQWARIASLLGRKSATQCKARWYEWLDPAIKKTPWTREEEEKLLHLVKVMPTSWRTIAPMIGRTAAQCIEHYERLIDQAQQGQTADGSKEGSAAAGSSIGVGSAPGKTGDVDAPPETKPARPDPVDMDEDELEMLSEARARLANTKGKKAKRKAREKQLEVAKRLALLQKRRELKAAGINVKLSRRKKNVTDYGTEIPFERKPVAGFYDTTEEDAVLHSQAGGKEQIGKLLQKYKGKTAAEKEEEAQKRDKAKRKELEKTNLPAALGLDRVAAPRSPPLKKAKLTLPPPQLSDLELEKLAKTRNRNLNQSKGMRMSSAKPPVPNGLLSIGATGSNQSEKPSNRSTHEPWAVARNKQVQTLLNLKSADTPLRGGENPDVPELGLGGRVTPVPTDLRTPNPLATPLMTPGSVYGTSTPGVPPKKRSSVLAELIKRGFADLPEPENEYELDFAGESKSSEDSTELSPENVEVEDAEDEANRRRNGSASLLESERLRLLSTAAKRDLPIPKPFAASSRLAIELNFLIKRDNQFKSLLKEEEENGGLVTVSMLDRLEELSERETLSTKEISRAADLVNEQIAEDGDRGFELQDQLLEVLKSRQSPSNGSPNLAVHESHNVDAETPMQKLELRERRAVLQKLYDQYKKETDNDSEHLSSLRERFITKEGITREANKAVDERSILSLIAELKEKQKLVSTD